MTDLVIYLAALVQGALAAAWLVERSHRHDNERSIRSHAEMLQAGLRRFNELEDRCARVDRALDQLYNKTSQRREKS